MKLLACLLLLFLGGCASAKLNRVPNSEDATSSVLTTQEVVKTLLERSAEIEAVPNSPATAKQRFSEVFTKLLMQTHFSLTPSLQCGVDGVSVSCMLMMITETAKHESDAKPNDEDAMTYLFFFSYTLDKNRNPTIVGNQVRYRIDQ